MRKFIDRREGEGELVQANTHTAYCHYIINVYQEDNNATTLEGSVALSKDGLTEAAFKKIVLNLLFHRTETYRLQTTTGQAYNITFGEFNAFTGDGVIRFLP